jgi:hypothetical protein
LYTKAYDNIQKNIQIQNRKEEIKQSTISNKEELKTKILVLDKLTKNYKKIIKITGKYQKKLSAANKTGINTN